MGGGMGWAELFFSGAGRISRAPFLIAAAILVAGAAIYEAAMGPTLHWITGWVVYPLLLFCGACVLSKRLHDRGRSGWWAALILFALVAVWPQPTSFFDFLFVLVLIWSGVELGVLPGEQGFNRYGANPLRPQAA
ncbi:MAG: DUF805 domain-containing protein [Phenylobacterium sp.]|uniref:DUF805 domain-containing protein n=1 Tax=Phenylobacterium sp. TaxID=1871053 RepID=UPI00391AF1C9